MDEAGDPTQKYMLIRDAVKDYLPLPNVSMPTRAPKMALPAMQLKPKVGLLSANSRRKLGRMANSTRVPVTFETIDQYSGFVLYETVLPNFRKDPAILSVPNIKDRAHVLIDDVSLSRIYVRNLFSKFFISFVLFVYNFVLIPLDGIFLSLLIY